MATLAVLVRSSHWSGRPSKCRLGPKVPPYILGLSVDPACRNPGVIGVRVVSDVKDIAPNLKEVLADRGFTQLADTFNRGVHRLGLDLVMDYKDEGSHPYSWVTTGEHWGSRTRRQNLRMFGGTLLATWTPEKFLRTYPKHRNRSSAGVVRKPGAVSLVSGAKPSPTAASSSNAPNARAVW